MKNKILSIVLFVLGGIFCVYDVYLIISSPGTFLDILTSFTHIWLLFGMISVFLGVWRVKKNHSFWQDTKTWFKIFCAVCVSFGVILSIVNLVFIVNPKTTSLETSVDYVILLGGGIDKDGKLPKSVQKRADKAADYLTLHPETKCVVTGGTLKWLPFAEAPELKRQLVLRGVAADNIYVEDQALDTIQNFRYSCAMLSEENQVSVDRILNSKILVVTSYFHLARAQRLARRLGFTNIYGLGSRVPVANVPHCYLREILAYVKLSLRIILTGEPSLITNL